MKLTMAEQRGTLRSGTSPPRLEAELAMFSQAQSGVSAEEHSRAEHALTCFDTSDLASGAGSFSTTPGQVEADCVTTLGHPK